MIVPFRQAARRVNLEQAKQHLTDAVIDIFSDRPRIDLVLAIGAGHRALERHEHFMAAVAVAEGVLNLWQDVVERSRQYLIVRRNQSRLRAYQAKLFAGKY